MVNFFPHISRPTIGAVLCLALTAPVLSSCASAPTMLPISPASAGTFRIPTQGSRDYAQVLPAIVSYMERELKLPIADSVVIVYSSQASYEAGVVAESENDIERLRTQLGPAGDQIRIED